MLHVLINITSDSDEQIHFLGTMCSLLGDVINLIYNIKNNVWIVSLLTFDFLYIIFFICIFHGLRIFSLGCKFSSILTIFGKPHIKIAYTDDYFLQMTEEHVTEYALMMKLVYFYIFWIKPIVLILHTPILVSTYLELYASCFN
jgi:hypothetical protein